MSLRVKLAVAMVALAAGATITVGIISYVSTEHELRSQVDASLREAVLRYQGRGDGAGGPLGGPARPGGEGDEPRNFTQILVQLLDAAGAIVTSPRSGALPVSADDIEIAADRGPARGAFADVRLDDEEYRILTVSTPTGAVQVARSLQETDRVLDRIRNRTLLIVVGMSVLALAIALVIAQQVTRRLVRLTETATRVAASGDLDVEVPVEGGDETSRLGRAFNDMLASLARSKRSQHQLVQDAGHELRTPLTSLRTNISVVRRFGELSPASQQRLLDDLDSETRELTDLVNELVQLATDRRDEESPTAVTMREVAEQVVHRAVRRSGRAISLDVDDTVVVVRPLALERAMTNVVGNAVKFTDQPVEVVVRDGRFEVLDRGPGISADDVGKVFDRFYRSVQARALPGSGLGLSIVREVAESHGGTVFAERREGGGCRIGFTLPPADVTDDS
jgi:two-component system, OmpR family, sensor histidine kinase MprB